MALEGVHAVITSRDIGEVPSIPIRIGSLSEYRAFLQPVIAVPVTKETAEFQAPVTYGAIGVLASVSAIGAARQKRISS